MRRVYEDSERVKEMKAERTDRALFFESLLKWGIESQFLMVVEECAELQHVILKRFRGQQNDNKLAEEISDRMDRDCDYIEGSGRISEFDTIGLTFKGYKHKNVEKDTSRV